MEPTLDLPARNKREATRFFDCFSRGDIAGALDQLTDDATWWIAGKPGQLPGAGSYSKERIARLFQRMAGQLKHGLQMTVKSAVAEGDRVALEVESRGELHNGRVYEQQYHFALDMRDGRICAVREYLDTQHVQAVWFQP
jgi:ketosteroid isomerase-like protein